MIPTKLRLIPGRAVWLSLTLLLYLGLPAVVAAHASLEEATPAPNSVLPAHIHFVTIRFTEAVEAEFSEIQVLNVQGERVDNGDSMVDPADPTVISLTLPTLPDGTYTVAWRALSAVDGHPTTGSYVYSVGQPISGAAGDTADPPPLVSSPLEPLVRWLILLSALAIVGGASFDWIVLQPVFSRRSGLPVWSALREAWRTRLHLALWLAIVAFEAASLLQLLLQASSLFGIPVSEVFGGPLRSAVTRTDWGSIWVWRIWLTLPLILFIATASTVLKNRSDRENALICMLIILAGLALLWTLSLVSHASASLELRGPALFSDYLHLVATAVWIGGLFHFALGLPLFFRRLDGTQRRTFLADLVPRFSTLAILSVGVLVITGLYSAWLQVTVLPALLTPYGLTLLAKLLLITPMLLLGWYNLRRLTPLLARKEEAGRHLLRSVRLEALLGVLALAAVGLLLSLEPARQMAAREGLGRGQGFEGQTSAEGVTIALGVEPGLTGRNRLEVRLADQQGNPIDTAEAVTVGLTYLGTDLGANFVTAAPEGDGRYVAGDLLMSVAGEWQAEVVVRRPDGFDARTAFRFPLLAGSAQDYDPSPQTGMFLWSVELLLLGLLFLGVGHLAGRWQTLPRLTLAGPGVIALATAAIILLAAMTPAQAEPPHNPFAPNAESLAIGRNLYAGHCALCHGPTGAGDGPLAAGFNPPPVNLMLHVPMHPDDYLFLAVKNGKPATAMPAFSGQLDDDQIWHLLNYLRALE